jgi:hypothetical protein
MDSSRVIRHLRLSRRWLPMVERMLQVSNTLVMDRVHSEQVVCLLDTAQVLQMRIPRRRLALFLNHLTAALLLRLAHLLMRPLRSSIGQEVQPPQLTHRRHQLSTLRRQATHPLVRSTLLRRQAFLQHHLDIRLNLHLPALPLLDTLQPVPRSAALPLVVSELFHLKGNPLNTRVFTDSPSKCPHFRWRRRF